MAAQLNISAGNVETVTEDRLNHLGSMFSSGMGLSGSIWAERTDLLASVKKGRESALGKGGNSIRLGATMFVASKWARSRTTNGSLAHDILLRYEFMPQVFTGVFQSFYSFMV